MDDNVAVLENIADKLYRPGAFGVEPYRLYLESRRINLNNRDQIKTYRTIRNLMTDELLSLKYDEVAEIHKKFANGPSSATRGFSKCGTTFPTTT